LVLRAKVEIELQILRVFFNRSVQPPAPVREISLVTRRIFSKAKLLHALQEVIVENLPQAVLGMKEGRVMGV
jgi:hypothetical protein